MFRSPRRSVALIALACTFSVAIASQGLAKTAQPQTDQGWRGFQVDPRSSGALNASAARAPKPAPPALFTGNRLISPTSINDPGADATAQDTQSETTVAALGSTVVVGFNDSGSFNGTNNHFTGFANSTDDGASYTDQGTLAPSPEGDAGDPVLTALSPTRFFMSTLSFRTGERVQVFKSGNAGATFGAPVNGTPGFTGSGDFQDKSWLTADTYSGTGHGNLYLCWTRFFGATGAQVKLTRSTNGGTSFGPSTGTLISNGGQGCNVVVGPSHEVYAFYYRGTGPGGQTGNNKLFVRKSTDRGVSFGPEVQVADLQTTSVNGDLALNGGLRSNTFPQAAVNPVSGDIVAVYNDDTVAGDADNGNVLYVKSVDGGATWSAPVRVNDDGGRDQFFPSVAISPTGGELMFGYYSRSHDPANVMFHRRARPGLMNTTTGAITLRPSAQLGPDTPVVIGQDPVINETYMGDYDQIAANADAFFSSWADNRDPDAFHANQPDVFAARVARGAPTTSTNVGVNVVPTPSTIDEGQKTVLTVRVNAGNHSARDVYVSLPPRAGLVYRSVSGGGGCDLINGFMNCSLGTIAAGTSERRNVRAIATAAGSRTATATVTTTDNDTAAANNVGSGTVTVNSVPKVTETYSTGDIAVAIPDSATVEVPLAVSGNSTLFDVNASVRLNHTFDSDLAISLLPPGGGPAVDLSSNNGGGANNYGTGANRCSGTPTVFDDSAATSITAAAAPFAGSFEPEGSLATLNGSRSGGMWTLRVADQAAIDTGTIGCFELRIRRAAP